MAVSFLWNIGTQLYLAAYGYKLPASRDYLNSTLKQSDRDIVNYTFSDGEEVYSILEYAVKEENLKVFSKLQQLKVPFVDRFALKYGNILHFYLDCLQDNFPHNEALLILILDNLQYIDQQDTVYLATPLEFALKKMARFDKFDWGIIETLFNYGAKIDENPSLKKIPLEFLCDVGEHWIGRRSFNEEKQFLKRLTDYLQLEKKHYPYSKSSLSLELFKIHTRGFRSKCVEIAATINGGHNSSQQVSQLIENMREYHSYFEILIKQSKFKDCFSLHPFVKAVQNNSDPLAQQAFMQFKSWGLPD